MHITSRMHADMYDDSTSRRPHSIFAPRRPSRPKSAPQRTPSDSMSAAGALGANFGVATGTRSEVLLGRRQRGFASAAADRRRISEAGSSSASHAAGDCRETKVMQRMAAHLAAAAKAAPAMPAPQAAAPKPQAARGSSASAAAGRIRSSGVRSSSGSRAAGACHESKLERMQRTAAYLPAAATPAPSMPATQAAAPKPQSTPPTMPRPPQTPLAADIGEGTTPSAARIPPDAAPPTKRMSTSAAAVHHRRHSVPGGYGVSAAGASISAERGTFGVLPSLLEGGPSFPRTLMCNELRAWRQGDWQPHEP